MVDIAGDGAVFFEPESIDDMANQILFALENLPGLRQRGAVNAERFKPETMLSAYQSTYRALLSRSTV
jgi:hypothetical protein